MKKNELKRQRLICNIICIHVFWRSVAFWKTYILSFTKKKKKREWPFYRSRKKLYPDTTVYLKKRQICPKNGILLPHFGAVTEYTLSFFDRVQNQLRNLVEVHFLTNSFSQKRNCYSLSLYFIIILMEPARLSSNLWFLVV